MSGLAKIETLRAGDVVRFGPDDPAVTVLKVKADRQGFDMLYQHNGAEPRWRGFDDGDSVYVIEAATA